MSGEDVLEIGVALWADEARYETEHRFASLPEDATLVALKREAASTFVKLYEVEPEGASVYVRFLTADERAAAADRTSADKT